MRLDDWRSLVVDFAQRGKASFHVPAHLELVKPLGSGAYGRVACFRDRRNGRMQAIKKITDAFEDRLAFRELMLVRQLDHENVIRLYDVLPPPSLAFDDLYLVTELMDTDLHCVIRSAQTISEEHREHFMRQILKALVYIHSAEVVHRDLKPSNVLVNSDCSLKLCDFGSAASFSSDAEDTAGTTSWYKAPEIILMISMCNPSIDIWAAGCILAELIARKPLFNGKHNVDQMRKILAVLGDPSADDLAWFSTSMDAEAFSAQFFPVSRGRSWADVTPGATGSEQEVMSSLLRFNPAVRVDARCALEMDLFAPICAEDDQSLDALKCHPRPRQGPSGTSGAALLQQCQRLRSKSMPRKAMAMATDPQAKGHHDTRLSLVDWSFDEIVPTKSAMQSGVYREIARMHPEIVERDRSVLAERCRCASSVESGLAAEILQDSCSRIAPPLYGMCSLFKIVLFTTVSGLICLRAASPRLWMCSSFLKGMFEQKGGLTFFF